MRDIFVFLRSLPTSLLPPSLWGDRGPNVFLLFLSISMNNNDLKPLESGRSLFALNKWLIYFYIKNHPQYSPDLALTEFSFSKLRQLLGNDARDTEKVPLEDLLTPVRLFQDEHWKIMAVIETRPLTATISRLDILIDRNKKMFVNFSTY